jgi:hypothetical protein
MRITSLALTMSMLSLSSCSDGSTGAAVTRLVIGTIDAGGTLEHVIEGPITALAGQPVVFTVSTFGNSCIQAAGAAVTMRGLEVSVTPYDQEYVRGSCLHYLKGYPRSITVTFDRTGTAVVRVQGRSIDRSGLVSVERVVSVLP